MVGGKKCLGRNVKNVYFLQIVTVDYKLNNIR